jgi:phage antirepressor YoqD-like protein
MGDQAPQPRSVVAQAHARGLLTFFEVAKLLDLEPTQVLDLMRDGDIEHERIDNKPCASLGSLDAYRRGRVA